MIIIIRGNWRYRAQNDHDNMPSILILVRLTTVVYMGKKSLYCYGNVNRQSRRPLPPSLNPRYTPPSRQVPLKKRPKQTQKERKKYDTQIDKYRSNNRYRWKILLDTNKSAITGNNNRTKKGIDINSPPPPTDIRTHTHTDMRKRCRDPLLFRISISVSQYLYLSLSTRDIK